MKNKIKYVFFLLTICFCHCLFGQLTPTGNEKRIDSLLTLIKVEHKDTNRVNILNDLGFEYSITNFPKAKSYLSQAEQLARKLNFKKGLANSLCNLGIAYETHGDYFEALNAQMLSLKIREEIGDKSGVSYSIHYIGDVYFGQSDLSDKASSKEDYNSKAMEEYFKSLKVAEEIGDIKSIANTFNCIGNSLREKGDYNSALEYYLKTVKIREQNGDKTNLSTTFVNIGKLYLKQNEYNIALEYLFKALKISEELRNKRTIVKALGTIGTVYLMEKKYDSAIEYSQKSLEAGRNIGYLEYIAKANKLLSQIYSDNNFSGRNNDKALSHYKAYIMERDSIDTKKASQLELQFDFDKKQELAKLEQEKKDAVTNAERKKQTIITFLIALGFLSVLLFSIFVFRSLKISKKQKQIIEAKQKDILDSIHYAKRIQQALLPTEKYIDKSLKRLKKEI